MAPARVAKSLSVGEIKQSGCNSKVGLLRMCGASLVFCSLACAVDGRRPILQRGPHRLHPRRSVVMAPKHVARNVPGDPLRNRLMAKFDQSAEASAPKIMSCRAGNAKLGA